VERHELTKVAYLSELEAPNHAAPARAGKGTPMLRVIENESGGGKRSEESALDRLAREGR
jgi:hypothetical protein